MKRTRYLRWAEIGKTWLQEASVLTAIFGNLEAFWNDRLTFILGCVILGISLAFLGAALFLDYLVEGE